jgi:SAM-dependent methyltransferase
MARRFPHVSVLGIDIAPLTYDPKKHPPNLRFQTYNMNDGMGPFHNQFDFIQMRCVGSGVAKAEETLRELEMSLKPGGLFTMIDGDIWLFNEHKTALPIAKLPGDEAGTSSREDGSWFARLTHGTHMVHVLFHAGLMVYRAPFRISTCRVRYTSFC